MSLTESLIACCCGPVNPCEAWNLICGRPNKVYVNITHAWFTTVSGTVQNQFVRETLESGTATLTLPFTKYTFQPYGAQNGYVAFVGDDTKQVGFSFSQTMRGWAYDFCVSPPRFKPQCGSTTQCSMQWDIANGQTASGVPAFTLGAQKLALVGRCGPLGITFGWGLQGYSGTGVPVMGAAGRPRVSEFVTNFCNPYKVNRWEQDLNKCLFFEGSVGYGKVGTISTLPACVPLAYRRCPKWNEIYGAQPTNYLADRYLQMGMRWAFGPAPNQPPVQNQATGCFTMQDEWTNTYPNASSGCYAPAWSAAYVASNFLTSSLSAMRHSVAGNSIRTDMGDGQYREESVNYFIGANFGGNQTPGVRLDCVTEHRWRIVVY